MNLKRHKNSSEDIFLQKKIAIVYIKNAPF